MSKFSEIKIRPAIGKSDLEVKIKAIIRLLKKGKQVKICIWFKGRELSHIELGEDVLNTVIEQIEGQYKTITKPNLSGKMLSIHLTPRG